MLDVKKLIDYLDENIRLLEHGDVKVGSFQDGSISAFSAVKLLVKKAEESET
ncbi:MAG TPA: hypothetical protein VFD03_01220 [Clostridia bacterium]|nr:hypothetical protein [Clostridia bacterium]